ncbi:hypothetical protein WG954_19395 [Lacibacter sp. H375]|uniref:hypothetical protein n=1 Tax=Lacibacter sp. H375 TaxID=3133424 RepID=UPI0030BCDB6F
MAKQIAAFLKGRLNNVLFYQLGDSYVARRLPAQVHQTEAMQSRSRNFGVAAAAGRILRSYWQELLPNPKDKHMQSRFSGVIAKWLGQAVVQDLPPQENLPFINGFCFSTETTLAERLRIPLAVTANSNGLVLDMPAFVPTQNITAPSATVSVELLFAAAACGLAQREYRGGVLAQLQLPYTHVLQPAQQMLLELPLTAGSLVVTAAAMRYTLADGVPEKRAAFLPAGVVDARWV